MSDEIDAAVKASIQGGAAQAARVGFNAAADTNPDEYAEASRVARRTGVPVDTVFAMPKEVKRQEAMGSINFDTLAQSSPATAKLLADVEKARIAHDDVENLAGVERTVVGTMGDVAVAALKGAVALPEAGVGAIDIPTLGMSGKLLEASGVRFKDASNFLDTLYSPAQQKAQANVANAQGFGGTLKAIAENPSTAATTIGESLPLMVGGAGVARGLSRFLPRLTPLASSALGEGIVGAGSAAEQIRQQNTDGELSVRQAFAALGSGAGTAVFAGMGGKIAARLGLEDVDVALSRAANSPEAQTLRKTFVRRLVEGGISEGVFEELPQSMQEKMWENFALGKPIMGGVPEAGAQGLVAGFGTGGGFNAARGMGKADAAERTAAQIEGLNQLAAASQVAARDPETFEQFVASAAEGGPIQHVFINADALMQSGVAEQVAAVSPAVAEQLSAALATGGSVAIPVGEYAARIAPTEMAPSLLDHLKTSADGFSRSEAQEYMQSHAADLQQEIAQVMEQRQGDEAFKASAEQVKAAVKEQLAQADRFTDPVHEQYASLVSNFYAVTAAKMGTTPDELFKQHPLRIQGDGVAGPREFNQSALPQVTGQIADKKGAKYDFSVAPQTFGKEAIKPNSVLVEIRDPATGERRGFIDFSMREDGVLTAENTKVAPSFRGSGLAEAMYKAARDAGYDIAPGKVQTDLGQGMVSALVKKGIINKEADGPRFAAGDLDLMPLEGGVLNQGALADEIEAALGAAMEDEPFAEYGLRIDDSVKTGGKLPVSRVWVDGVATEDVLDGTSAIGVKKGEVRRALRDLQTYPGSKVVLVMGDSGRSGEDVGERIIKDAKAVAVFDRPELNQGERGSFSPSTNTISLFRNADLSTFLHEAGHFFLETTINLAQQENAPDAMRKDLQTLLTWFGVSDINEWNSLDFEEKRSYHEQFARGFEAYLFEGKAPSIEMQGVFQRFRAWLVNVYRDIKSLNVELTDEVRQVMDRMIATSEQIALAEQSASMMPLFTSPDQAGMTVEEFAAYHEQGIAATADAVQDLQARGLRDMQWMSNAKGREVQRLKKEAAARRAEIEMEVRREVMSRPIYQAWQFLTAKAQDGLPTGKLSRTALADLYGGFADGKFDQHATLDWKRLIDQRMTAADGLDPNLVAEKFGFGSGDELVRAILAANKPQVEIEGLTDARMLERFGELSSQEAIEREADKAIHNEARARMLATEANALAKATGGRRILVSAAKTFAANMISRLKIKDIRPNQYASAEARAAKAAATASRSNDLQAAAAEKRNQLINNYATRAAYDAQEEADKIDRFFKKIVSSSDERVGKTRDMDIVNAARAVLANFGYGQKAKGAMDYLKSVSANDPAMYEVLRASIEAAQGAAKPSIREMTMDELRALNDEVGSMWHLAKRNRQMEVDGDMMDREDAAAELRARMEEIGIPDQAPGETSSITPEEERAMKIASAKAIGRRVESWVDLKDGNDKMGPFRRLVWNPIKEAADRYRTDKVAYLREFREIFATIAPSLKQGLIFSPELNWTFGKDSGGVAMNEVIHAILHTGNDSNKRKLLLGREWATENADGTLDTSKWDAFVKRLIDEGKLKKEHFDFAQRIWDLMEKTKPLAQRAHRDAFGKYFDEVAATSFTTPFGEYRGGYVPATTDSRVVKDAELRKLIEEGRDGMAYAFPATSSGFTKSRVDYNKPLMLDMRTLPQHIDKVLLFSHLEMPVRDAAKLLAAKPVSGALNRTDPSAISSMLMPWLARTARQQVTTPVAGAGWMMRMLNTARNRTSMATMLGNVSNAAQQITGFMLAGVKVKPTEMLAATASYLRHPRRTAQEVADLSPYMANRMGNEVAAMMGEIEAILLDPSVYQRAQEWTKRHTYFLQSAVDNVMGPIIWKAAYNQALTEDFDPKNAARIADSVIRQTQGSTLPEDVSRIETGPAYARLFTQFYGYFNMQANLLGTEFGKVSQEMGVRKGMGRGFYITLMGFVAPAIVAEGIAQAFRGGPADDDKDGEYLDDWLMALLVYGPLRNATAFVPFVGTVANSAVARFNHNPVDDKMSVSPVVGAVEGAAGVPIDLYKAAIGEGNAQRTVRDVATLISLTTGLPASVAARPIGFLAGMGEGKIQPTSGLDSARGLVSGVGSPASRQ